jgi:hypothetical protein
MDEQTCDLCGSPMQFRSGSNEALTEGELPASISSDRWDCTCGRSMISFQSTASLTVEAVVVPEAPSD